jgi:hypothetical protein
LHHFFEADPAVTFGVMKVELIERDHLQKNVNLFSSNENKKLVATG